MDGASRYQAAADEYVSLREVNPISSTDEPPERPPRKIQNAMRTQKSSNTSAVKEQFDLPPKFINTQRESSSSMTTKEVSSQNDDAAVKEQVNMPTQFMDTQRESLITTNVKEVSAPSDEDLPFAEYLKEQGLTEATIQLLDEEEISSIHTLKALTEDDINELGLKVGQKALIRNLTIKEIPPEPANMTVETTKTNTATSGGLELNCYCMEETGKGKLVAELTTKKSNSLNPVVNSRILLLVDTSGSMGIKTGKRRKYSKLYRIKGFAKRMIDSLDDGDFASVVTFGETSHVMLPMTKVTRSSRDKIKDELDTLDKSYLSTKTNLSTGVLTALDVFKDASMEKSDLLGYKNSIIILSDGEINAGTEDPGKLVHEVRERVRELSYGLDDSLNQWVSISTVVLGKSASEAMYCLSKFCSSDAFYTLDMDVDKASTETNIFLPVLMRKAAVAWNVSVHIESLNGATIHNDECTQDNKVRVLGRSGRGARTEKAYFYYDIPAASTKHIGIALNLDDADDSDDVLKMKIEYTGFLGERHTVVKSLTKRDFFQRNEKEIGKALAENYKNEARLISEAVLNKAAKQVISGNSSQSSVAIEEGKSDLKKLLNKYGEMASQEVEAKTEIFDYAKCLVNNMESLLQVVQTRNEDEDEEDQANSAWLKIKSVSSAITREAPTFSETVADGNILCPMPGLTSVTSTPMREEMERVYKEQGVRESFFFDFDTAIEELQASVKKS